MPETLSLKKNIFPYHLEAKTGWARDTQTKLFNKPEQCMRKLFNASHLLSSDARRTSLLVIYLPFPAFLPIVKARAG